MWNMDTYKVCLGLRKCARFCFFVGHTVIADKVMIDLYMWLAELKVRNISGGLMDAHLQKGK